MNRKSFQNIVIQSKDDKTDFRAFAHVTDSEGNKWELRAYGKTAGEAADGAWQRYKMHEDYWDIFGSRK